MHSNGKMNRIKDYLPSSSSTEAHDIQFREGEASPTVFFSGTTVCLSQPGPLHKIENYTKTNYTLGLIEKKRKEKIESHR